jgi:hypothetical protein
MRRYRASCGPKGATASASQNGLDDPMRAIIVLFCCAAQRRFGDPTMWYV